MPRLLPPNVKLRIVKLRRCGFSIPEISQKLIIPKSSVQRYCKKVQIAPQFKQRWLDRRNASKIISDKAWAVARQKATKLIKSISQKERQLIACALYWAEGNKKDLSFTNTDPEMIAIFMDVLRSEFKVADDSFRISIRIYEDLDKEACVKHWSKITKIDLRNNVSLNILKGEKTGKLKYGMCRVRVLKGGLLLKSIFAINRRVVKLISPHSSTDRIRHS